jgi:hypothetical protein
MRSDRALSLLAGLLLLGATARPVARSSGDPQDLFRDDVHAKAGLSCVSCHAGAPPYGRSSAPRSRSSVPGVTPTRTT